MELVVYRSRTLKLESAQDEFCTFQKSFKSYFYHLL